MWTTVAVVAALSAPADDAGGLKLTNVRATCGVLGPVRAGNGLIPGCSYSISFDVEGITIDPSGKVRYSTTVEVTDDKGKLLFKQQPRDLEAVAALGGQQIPAYARLDVGLDQPPGECTVRVTVKDLASGKSATISRKVEVKPLTFGLVRVTATSDQQGTVPAGSLSVGESLWVGGGVVGFARDRSTKQPHLRLSLRVLDDAGKPTLEKPFTGDLMKDVPENVPSVPAQFYLLLNRPGKFTVELQVEDLIAKKSAKIDFPITVAAAK